MTLDRKAEEYRQKRFTRRKLTRLQEGQIVELLAKNVPYEVIQQQFPIQSTALTEIKANIVDPILTGYGDYMDWRRKKRDYIDNTLGKTLKLINDKFAQTALENLELRDLSYAFKVLFEAGRLEAGLSTRNVAQQVDQHVTFTASKITQT